MSFVSRYAGSCVTKTALAHTSLLSWIANTRLEVQGHADNCPSGYEFEAWYFPEVGGPVLLATGLSTPTLSLPKTPIGAGHGRYSFAEHDPQTGWTAIVGGNAQNDYRNTKGQFGETVGTATWGGYEYVHQDHLGSTRLVTDASGQELAQYKYYPFGHYAETAGQSQGRMRFTGHERDEGVGLDYMRARYCGTTLGRFSSVDTANANPAIVADWNRYLLTRNNPTKYVDDTGQYPTPPSWKQHKSRKYWWQWLNPGNWFRLSIQPALTKATVVNLLDERLNQMIVEATVSRKVAGSVEDRRPDGVLRGYFTRLTFPKGSKSASNGVVPDGDVWIYRDTDGEQWVWYYEYDRHGRVKRGVIIDGSIRVPVCPQCEVDESLIPKSGPRVPANWFGFDERGGNWINILRQSSDVYH